MHVVLAKWRQSAPPSESALVGCPSIIAKAGAAWGGGGDDGDYVGSGNIHHSTDKDGDDENRNDVTINLLGNADIEISDKLDDDDYDDDGAAVNNYDQT